MGALGIAGRGCPGAPGPSWLSLHAATPRPQRPPAVPGSCTETISVGVLGEGAPALPRDSREGFHPCSLA